MSISFCFLFTICLFQIILLFLISLNLVFHWCLSHFSFSLCIILTLFFLYHIVSLSSFYFTASLFNLISLFFSLQNSMIQFQTNIPYISLSIFLSFSLTTLFLSVSFILSLLHLLTLILFCPFISSPNLSFIVSYYISFTSLFNFFLLDLYSFISLTSLFPQFYPFFQLLSPFFLFILFPSFPDNASDCSPKVLMNVSPRQVEWGRVFYLGTTTSSGDHKQLPRHST